MHEKIVSKIPPNLIKFENKKRNFDPANLLKETKKLASVLGKLKKINYEIFLRDSPEGFDIIVRSTSKIDDDEIAKNNYQKQVKKAVEMIDIIGRFSKKNNKTTIFLPENVEFNPLSEVNPKVKNGTLYIKNAQELKQLVDIDSILKTDDIFLDNKIFSRKDKNATDFIVNEHYNKDLTLKLKYAESSYKDEIKVNIPSINSSSRHAIKIKFFESIENSKQHLKLLTHSLYNEKNDFTVVADITTTFNIDKDTTQIKSIFVKEVIDFGLNYKKSKKKWE